MGDRLTYSVGKNTFDNKPRNCTAASFGEFERAILAKPYAEAKGLRYIAASFTDGRRSKATALPRAWLPFDFDMIADGETFSDLCMFLSRYVGFGYTTASHTSEKPRARAILAADREMTREECRRVCLAIDQKIRDALGDRVGLDASVYRAEQPVYTPTVGSQIVRWTDGEVVDVDELLAEAPEIEERPGKRERLEGIASTDPVLRALIDLDMVKKDMGDGRYAVECPCSSDHTGSSGESSTVYFLPMTGGVQYGRFHCLHAHCQGRDNSEFLAALGLNPTSVYREQRADENAKDQGINESSSVALPSNFYIELKDPETGKPKSQATLLIEIATARASLFCDPEREAYAVITCRGPREVHPVRSREFSEFLSSELYALTQKGCNRNSLADALATIEAKAKAANDERKVHIRSVRANGAVYIDLCDAMWRVIEVDTAGWRVLDKSPVEFIRKKGAAPFPEPVSGGSVDQLRALLTVDNEQFILLATWITACLAGVAPFAVVVLQGEQGTGKSWTSRILRQFIDPSTVPLRSPPREVRDLLVSARNGYLIALDNLSGISPEISDTLCRLSTGNGIDTRQLYTDMDQVLIEVQRPILCNGIDDIATRPDLAERSIIVGLQVIDPTKRIPEADMHGRLASASPAILGAFLDAVSAGLRELPTVNPDRLPRMADFAMWGYAVERALGFAPGAFISAYDRNQQQAVHTGLEASPVAVALLRLLDRTKSWKGSSGALYDALTNQEGTARNSKAWPQTPRGMTNALRRLAPSFRRIGISITQDENHDRYYTIVQAPENVPHVPHVPQGLIHKENLGADDGADGADGAYRGADGAYAKTRCAPENPVDINAQGIRGRRGTNFGTCNGATMEGAL